VLASVSLPPVWLAAVLLVGRAIAGCHDLTAPAVEAILAATGASRSGAYEAAARLQEALPTLVRGPGRPARVSPPSEGDARDLTRAVLDYVMAHPGCVHQGGGRQRYAAGFRRFVLEQRAAHAALDLDTFASAVAVPIGTLKDWLRDPTRGATEETPAPPPARPDAEATHIQSVLDAWSRWSGSFLDFCEHVKRDLRIPFGRDLVGRILEVEGARRPARREGRSPDEVALRKAFRTYFPGAEWVGDGMQIPVVIDGHRFVFNLELDVDAHTGALVGLSVGAVEDSGAVVDTFASGVATTGAPPLALLLDNKPSNHTPEVDAALGETIRIRATPERPQNKAHVEGAFGLFSQVLPSLVLDTRGAAEAIARRLLGLVVDVWARTTNHRPRRDRNGRSRVDLYADSPSDEQIAAARQELRETADRQERARRTLEARRRPEVLALLDDYFARLALLDPERHVRIAIAGYPKDAIMEGLATFSAKRRAGSLPDGADARYLLGIVKNITAKTECEYLAEELYRIRTQMRDLTLAPLRAELDSLRAEPDPLRVLVTCVERALDTTSNLERTFWLDALAETLRARPEQDRERLFVHASRLIAVTFTVTPRERQDAIRHVADRLLPVT
jgi:hypothetical protein